MKRERLEALLEVEPFEYPDDRNPADVYVMRHAEGSSRATAVQVLEWIARVASGGEVPFRRFPWHRLRYVDTVKLVAKATADYTPKGARLRAAMLRGVLREAWRLEWLSAEDFQRSIEFPKVRGKTLPRGRQVERGELLALFDSIRKDSRPIGRRDCALFALGYGAGLRRAELASLKLADLDLEAGVLRIHGKGRRQRVVAIIGGTRRALEAWVEVRGRAAGPLFWASKRDGTLDRRGITPQAIRHVCDRRSRAAGVASFTPHDLRRSSATDLLEAGVDALLVAAQLGHERIESTQIYDLRDERDRRKAVEVLHVPVS